MLGQSPRPRSLWTLSTRGRLGHPTCRGSHLETLERVRSLVHSLGQAVFYPPCWAAPSLLSQAAQHLSGHPGSLKRLWPVSNFKERGSASPVTGQPRRATLFHSAHSILQGGVRWVPDRFTVDREVRQLV